MHITIKHIIPAAGLAAVLAAALAAVALKWVLLMAAIECCITIAFDPYSLLERRLAPVSRAMIITAAALALIGLYWFIWVSVPALLIVLLVAGLLVGLVVRYNAQWTADYLFFASSNVKQALVSVGDLPHLKAWERTGKRECDTMLRQYWHITASQSELDTLYRSVYALGFVRAYQMMDGRIDRHVARYEQLQADYNALVEQSVSIEDYEELKRELEDWQTELAGVRELWANDTASARYWRSEANRVAVEYQALQDAYEELQRELVPAELVPAEETDFEVEDVPIVTLPTLDERILKDRAEGMSYSQLADKYGKTKSQIQYICKKGVAAS